MAKAISNRNVLNAKFKVSDFTGKWLASFGKPELCGSWIIYGKSGSGKTSFALELCKYLSGFKKSAYDTMEQGLSLSFQKAWQRAEMHEAGNNVVVLNKEGIKELKERLKKKKSADIIIIDSLICLVGFTRRDYLKLLEEFPTKLFIFLCHEKNSNPDPAIGETIKRLADIKIRIEGYKAFINTRYSDTDKGEGIEDFVIWEYGANEYWANI